MFVILQNLNIPHIFASYFTEQVLRVENIFFLLKAQFYYFKIVNFAKKDFVLNILWTRDKGLHIKNIFWLEAQFSIILNFQHTVQVLRVNNIFWFKAQFSIILEFSCEFLTHRTSSKVSPWRRNNINVRNIMSSRVMNVANEIWNVARTSIKLIIWIHFIKKSYTKESNTHDTWTNETYETKMFIWQNYNSYCSSDWKLFFKKIREEKKN